MSQRDLTQPRRRHEQAPIEKPMRVTVYPDCLRLDFYNAKEPGRKYTVRLPRWQSDALFDMIADAQVGSGPRQFLLGFGPEDLAFHRIDAVEAGAEA